MGLICHFWIEETPYTRLCCTKNILIMNEQFPGPPLFVKHGVRLPRSPWWDGPEYVTQCPIKPRSRYRYKVIFSTEEGTLWWHAHTDWTRFTVHGPIINYPKLRTTYLFPKPYEEVPIVLGEWWNRDIMQVYWQLLCLGGAPNVSDAFTINGQPGDLYPCSKQATPLGLRSKDLSTAHNQRSDEHNLFFAVAKHKLTVVGIDASYTKPHRIPHTPKYAFLEANQFPNHYYMAARVYSSGQGVAFDNTTTTAILQFSGGYTPSSFPPLPYFPFYNNTAFLASKEHPAMVPLMVDTQIITTISVNTFPCHYINNSTCQGNNGTRLATSMNNISYTKPSISILQAYNKDMIKVFGEFFPSRPPLIFNFTAKFLPLKLQTPTQGIEVKLLDYDSTMELVLQGTNLVAGADHPVHLHGHSFYIVGWGFGNFDKNKHPLWYNLMDPLHRNIALVPKNGWIAIRFHVDNPGVWFMHCHWKCHLTCGMDTVFINKNGLSTEAQLAPPPADLPPC
ncbi:hypothetical protein NE237_018188 [Protea cynaroides]|uniref:laccase n=1 Tax=Protea cynaroides TaxID=273540 RepID=A0A9Q0K9H0_9MAGN|nr:hypothetical protein NE237_018188 [Protea cynaroides]